MVKYGYCRVSRPTQNIERQIRNILTAYPDAVILREVHTRTSFEKRNVWKKLMKTVQAGDSIIFDSVSRMSGNEDEGIEAYMDLYSKGVELVFLNEPHINTATYKNALTKQVAMTGTDADIILEAVNRYLMVLAAQQIRLAFAQSEKEVTDLRLRTKGGMETARLAGKQIGRQKGKTYETKKSKEAKADIVKMAKEFGGAMKDKDCIRLLGISPNTYYKYKQELRAMQENELKHPYNE
jgi:DNA invertase Pin-like site-specific DNA recombinase